MFDMKYYYLEFTYPRIVFATIYIPSKSGGVMSARGLPRGRASIIYILIS